MVNSVKKNTERVSKIVKPLVSVDWTKVEGETPFFEQSASTHPARYAVAYTTHFVDLKSTNRTAFQNARETFISGASTEILKFYNKDLTQIPDVASRASIPGFAGSNFTPEGVYVPLRPGEPIKVLVTIPDKAESNNFSFDNLLDAPPQIYGYAYDEIQLNSFKLSEKANKVANLLEKFDKQATKYEGRVYNLDFKKEAEKIRNFIPALQKLIQDNGFAYSETQSDLMMLGISSSYDVKYAQINQGEGFKSLPTKWSQFQNSKFTKSRTMFIYKNLDDIVQIAKQKPSIDTTASPDQHSNYGFPSNGKLKSPMGWQEFSQTYIKFPAAKIEHSTGRSKSPPPNAAIDREIAKANAKTIKNSDAIKQENWRLQQRALKKDMIELRKNAKDFVGDNVLGNINEAYHTLNTIEDAYSLILNKLGIAYIVKSAAECAGVGLPIREIKDFLLDAENFIEDVIQIFEIPVLTLDDLIPTVDIMADIGKQILLAITEAVKKALIEMIKSVILMLLEACNNGGPGNLNFCGMSIPNLMEGGSGDKSFLDTVGVIGGGAVLDGIKSGVKNTGNLQPASRDFLQNLNAFVDNDELQELAADGYAPISDFLDQVSAVMTPPEIAKLLQGKAPQDVVKIIQTVSNNLSAGNKTAPGCVDPDLTSATTADRAPAFKILQGLLSDEDKINDFFLNVGKVVDEGEILEQIENLEKIIPETSVGLCDLDDSFLRCDLLKGKGMTEAECKEHNKASQDRQQKRINELADILQKDNPLDSIPPLYCTYKDGKLQEGLISRSHPSFDFMLDTMLDTAFAGIYNSFTQDISGVPELMSREVNDGVEIIPRTKRYSAARGGTSTKYGFLIINPDFTMAIKQGYAPSPPFREVDAWNEEAPNDNEDALDDPDDLTENMLWANRKTIELNHRLPGLKKPRTKRATLPGLGPESDAADADQGIFGKFQTSLALEPALGTPRISEEENQKARDLLRFDNRNFSISIENQIKTDLQNFGVQSAGGASLLQTFQNEVARTPELRNMATTILGVDKYTVFYSLSSDADDFKDKFKVFIKADSANIYDQIFNLDIPSSAQTVIRTRGLESGSIAMNSGDETDSMVEKRFVGYLSKIWTEGENIYVAGPSLEDPPTPATKPSYGKNFIGGSLPIQVRNALLKNQGVNATQDPSKRAVKSLYEEILRDLTAACMERVKDSPLLGEDVFRSINLTPKECIKPGDAPGADSEFKDPMLLDLDGVKSKVKRRYKELQCAEPPPFNTSGLCDNRNNALEQSVIYGTILATVRTYALEAVLKALVTFSQLNVSDIDEVFVAYVRDNLMDEIREKFYLDDFMQQVLKSYNSIENPNPKETNPVVALDWFVRKELNFAVNKLLRASGQENRPIQHIDQLLFNTSANPQDRGLFPEFDVVQKAIPSVTKDWHRRHEHDHASDYHVISREKIIGIKDWRNGSFYLEKYIRSEIDYDSPDVQRQLIDKGHVTPIVIQGQGSSASRHAHDDAPYNGVCNLEALGVWFNSAFGDASSMDQSFVTPFFATIPDQQITDEDCAPPQTIAEPGDPGSGPPGASGNQEQPVGGRNPLFKYFKTMRVGVRLVCQVCVGNDIAGGLSEADNPPIWKDTQEGSQLAIIRSPSGDPVDLSFRAKLNKAYTVAEAGSGPHRTVYGFTFPIVCAEKEIDLNTQVGEVLYKPAANELLLDPNSPDARAGMSAWFRQKHNEASDELFKILKDSDEYSFMFDYCFPLNRIVSLTAMYNSTFLLPYPGLSDAFINTKEQMRISMLSMLQSGNYQYKDLAWSSKRQANIAINGGEVPGFNFALMAVKFIMAIFRTTAEESSPNISLARKIQMVTEMVGGEALKAVEKALGDSPEAERAKCDLASQFPEIPMWIISLLLLPVDVFGPLPLGIGIGPPITPIGWAYLALFGLTRNGPGGMLSSEFDKIRERCAVNEKLRSGTGRGQGQPTLPLSAVCELKDDEELRNQAKQKAFAAEACEPKEEE